MQTLDEILTEARRLPEGERKRLVADLQADSPTGASQIRRQAAMKRWLDRGGSGHSDFTDVSGNKTTHLAEIYATKP